MANRCSAAFFTVHYGLFCFVHGAIVATLFGGIQLGGGSAAEPVLLMIGRVLADAVGVLVAAGDDRGRGRRNVALVGRARCR